MAKANDLRGIEMEIVDSDCCFDLIHFVELFCTEKKNKGSTGFATMPDHFHTANFFLLKYLSENRNAIQVTTSQKIFLDGLSRTHST